MSIYTISRDYVLAGCAELIRAGSQVEISDEEAARLKTYEPDLLSAPVVTTQESADVVKSDDSEETPRPRKRVRA